MSDSRDTSRPGSCWRGDESREEWLDRTGSDRRVNVPDDPYEEKAVVVKPYYEHGGITIYHGDCRDVLLGLSWFAGLVLTDPPYGISHPTDYARAGRSRKLQRLRARPR
jgi:hypothetical protein